MANQGQRNSLKPAAGGEAASAAAAPRKVEKNSKMTAVRKDGIMKELIDKEEKAKTDWGKKFGFIVEDREEFVRNLAKLKLLDGPAESKKSEEPKRPNIPITSSAMVGWGAERASELNVAGPLYVSPKSSIIAEAALGRKLVQKQKHIVLG